MSSAERNKALVRQYFHELWKGGDLAAADALLAPDAPVRGSLGMTATGPDGLRAYVRMVRTALPDLRLDVEQLIAERDRVAARVRYSGTHLGPLHWVGPTGRAVSYAGVTLFRIAGGRIAELWSVGDGLGLMAQLGAFPGAAGGG